MYNHELTSRVHQLKFFPNGGRIYLKRDDELSCTISGSKVRKYSSLVPFLIETNSKRVGIIGGQNSNNLFGLAQLLCEVGITPVVFTKKISHAKTGSNFDFVRLFVDEENIYELETQDWDNVEEMVRKNYEDKFDFLVPEGGNHISALSGAETIGNDLIANFGTVENIPSNIFIDSGTGLTAAAMINSLNKNHYSGTIHVLDLIGCGFDIRKFYKSFCSRKDLLIRVHRPEFLKSFGSINRHLFEFIKDFAKREGVLLDPIYSAKLLKFSCDYIEKHINDDETLVVHTGGQWALNGFHDSLFL